MIFIFKSKFIISKNIAKNIYKSCHLNGKLKRLKENFEKIFKKPLTRTRQSDRI